MTDSEILRLSEEFSTLPGAGLGNAAVAQLIHILNDYYQDWRETTLFLSGIMSTIVLFGALFRPVEFTFHRKKKNYHHTMHDKRLPPSCMTSMEKLQRFINEMDKQCALRHAHQSVSMSASNNERVSTTVDDNDAISIANESDLFDSYSAGDITEIQQENSPKIDMVTFREKIFSDMAFLNERWKKISKKQGETGSTSRLFRMPNFRYLISNKAKERHDSLMVPNQHIIAFTDKINPSSHSRRERSVTTSREQNQNGLLSKISLEDNAHKSPNAIKLGQFTAICPQILRWCCFFSIYRAGWFIIATEQRISYAATSILSFPLTGLR